MPGGIHVGGSGDAKFVPSDHSNVAPTSITPTKLFLSPHPINPDGTPGEFESLETDTETDTDAEGGLTGNGIKRLKSTKPKKPRSRPSRRQLQAQQNSAQLFDAFGWLSFFQWADDPNKSINKPQ